LVELLVVITIIAILAFMAVSSYGKAQRQAKLDIAADTLVSMIKEQQGAAKSGRVAGDSGLQCYGIRISTDGVKILHAEYVSVDDVGGDYCKAGEALPKDFPIPEMEVRSVDSSEDILTVFFKPPQAKIALYMGNSDMPSPADFTLTIEIGLPNVDDTRKISFDTVSGLVERIYEQN